MTPPPSHSSSTRALFNQFITLLLVIIALSISLTFLFVQTPAPQQQTASTIMIVWDGMRPDMVSSNLTPRLQALGDSGAVALAHHAVYPSISTVQEATLATGALPGDVLLNAPGDGSGSLPVTASTTTGTGITSALPYWVLPTSANATGAATPTHVATATVAPTATAAATATNSHTISPTPTVGATATPGNSLGITSSGNTGQVWNLGDPATQLKLQNVLPGGLVQVPTLAAEAIQAGMGISYEGTGGAGLLPAIGTVAKNPGNTYIIDQSYTYPFVLNLQLATAGITPGTTAGQQSTYLTRAYTQVVLPQLLSVKKTFLSVIDIPDIAQAGMLFGEGSPQQLVAIQSADMNLGVLLDTLANDAQLDNVNVIVTSDNGLLAVLPPNAASLAGGQASMPGPAQSVAVAQRLRSAQLNTPALAALGSQGVSTGAVTPMTTTLVIPQGSVNMIYLPTTPALSAIGGGDVRSARQTLTASLVTWLQQQPWIGPIFVAPALGKYPGTLTLADVMIAGPRSPAIVFGFVSHTNDHAPLVSNPQQFAGSTVADTEALATSGGMSRREMQTIFYANGPSFAQGVRDIAPTGVLDVAPTIARVLGLPTLADANGRVIIELLRSGGNPDTITQGVLTSKTTLPDGRVFFEAVQVEHVGAETYIDAGGVTTGTSSDSDATLTAAALQAGGV